MRFPLWFISIPIGATFTLLGCQQSKGRQNEPVEPCELNQSCVSGVRGSIPPGTGGGGEGQGGGGPGLVDLSGSIGIVAGPSFETTSVYSGPATLYGPGPKDRTVEATSTDGTFTLSGVTARPFLFVDTKGFAGTISTYSNPVTTDADKIVVPVLDATFLQSIAQAQPGAPALDTNAVHVVLLVERKGQPLSGIALQSDVGSALVAYDQGSGIYSGQFGSTGTEGAIVILNLAISAEGQLMLRLFDAMSNAYKIMVPVVPRSATLARIEL